MAIAVHVMLDNSDEIVSFNRLGDAISELNVASFAGVGGVAVVAVGRTHEDARKRVVDYTQEEATKAFAAE